MTQQKNTRCPAGMMTVGGKTKLQITYHLLSETRRFGELQRLIPEASRQMLTMQLRELEQMGMLHRQVYAQVPPKVEYSLTELGRSFEPVLRQLYAWSEWYGEQMGLEWPQLIAEA
jgi:DNA-binding HxlR family transcriptional regulator